MAFITDPVIHYLSAISLFYAYVNKLQYPLSINSSKVETF